MMYGKWLDGEIRRTIPSIAWIMRCRRLVSGTVGLLAAGPPEEPPTRHSLFEPVSTESRDVWLMARAAPSLASSRTFLARSRTAPFHHAPFQRAAASRRHRNGPGARPAPSVVGKGWVARRVRG